MTSELIKFHKKCQPEYIYILQEFNLLFYGYGCKQNLLMQLFPEAKIFNCKFLKLKNIVEELIIDGVCEKAHSSIKDIDKELVQRNKTIILICINFSFDMVELQNLKAIKLIGTLETINFSHDQDDIESFNFVHRDLTTFEDYTEETIDIDLYANNVVNSLMVLKSVSKNSKIVFKHLVTLGNCHIDNIFGKIRKKLMVSKKNVVMEYLHEFVDHGIVRCKDRGQLILNLSENDRNSLLECEEFKEIIL